MDQSPQLLAPLVEPVPFRYVSADLYISHTGITNLYLLLPTIPLSKQLLHLHLSHLPKTKSEASCTLLGAVHMYTRRRPPTVLHLTQPSD